MSTPFTAVSHPADLGPQMSPMSGKSLQSPPRGTSRSDSEVPTVPTPLVLPPESQAHPARGGPVDPPRKSTRMKESLCQPLLSHLHHTMVLSVKPQPACWPRFPADCANTVSGVWAAPCREGTSGQKGDSHRVQAHLPHLPVVLLSLRQRCNSGTPRVCRLS